MPSGVYKRTKPPSMKGKKHSVEACEKMSKSRKGRKLSEAHKKKISESNKGKHSGLISKETRRKISETLKGHKLSKESIQKRTQSRKGYRHSETTRGKMHDRAVQRVVDGRHNSYRGGITPINKKIRQSLEYKLVREACFKRDNWTCLWCLERGGKLNADHIKPFALFPELRFALDNLRTLCVPCHRKTDTYGSKTKS